MTVLDSSQPIPEEFISGLYERFNISSQLGHDAHHRIDPLILQATAKGLLLDDGNPVSFDLFNAKVEAERLISADFKPVEAVMKVFAAQAAALGIEFGSDAAQTLLQDSHEIPGTSGLQKQQSTEEPAKGTASKIFGIFSK